MNGSASRALPLRQQDHPLPVLHNRLGKLHICQCSAFSSWGAGLTIIFAIASLQLIDLSLGIGLACQMPRKVTWHSRNIKNLGATELRVSKQRQKCRRNVLIMIWCLHNRQRHSLQGAGEDCKYKGSYGKNLLKFSFSTLINRLPKYTLLPHD